MRQIWLVTEVVSNLYLSCSAANIFDSWLGTHNMLRILIRVEVLAEYGCFGYVK
jgi:hypothetical protein